MCRPCRPYCPFISVVFAAAACLLAGSAIALDAYRTEVCRSGELVLEYHAGRPVGEVYSLALGRGGQKFLALPADMGPIYSREQMKTADFLFTTTKSVETERPRRGSQGCYDLAFFQVQKTISFVRVSRNGMNSTGVTAKQSVDFNCYIETGIFNGRDCGI